MTGTDSRRRGFTIVELLLVIGIISVLITITVSAVSGSLKRGRSVRASALCSLVQQGIATYHAQMGEWPVEPKNTLEEKGTDAGYYVYPGESVRQMVRLVVEQTRNANPMMDVSGLFVSTSTGEADRRAYGTDFMSAIHGTPQHPKRIRLNQMYFGYPDPNTGYFRRFKIRYHPGLDTVEVSMQ